MIDKIVIFDGKKYIRNAKNRYYFEYNTKTKNRIGKSQLHRAVWEFYNGEIPKGYHIHHIDKNVDNNDISNLECIIKNKHLSNHSKENWKNDNYRKKMENYSFSNKERQEKAKLWHKSEEGKEWHKKHAKNSICKNEFEEVRVCKWCGKEYIARKHNSMYCNKKCQNKACNFKKDKICEICGKIFHSTSYKARTCSLECKKRLF